MITLETKIIPRTKKLTNAGPYQKTIRALRKDWRQAFNGKPIEGFLAIQVKDPFDGDLDNHLKPLLDSLKGVVIVDDSQIVELLTVRAPSDHPYLTIKIWELGTILTPMQKRIAAGGGW